MNKILVTLALLGLGMAPAHAGEGNGDPFPNNAGALSTHSTVRASVSDTGSAAYPSRAETPGSELPRLAGELLPANGSESVVQTAGSLPNRFEQGTVAYSQASQVVRWVMAHPGRAAPVIAFMPPARATAG